MLTSNTYVALFEPDIAYAIVGIYQLDPNTFVALFVKLNDRRPAQSQTASNLATMYKYSIATHYIAMCSRIWCSKFL